MQAELRGFTFQNLLDVDHTGHTRIMLRALAMTTVHGKTAPQHARTVSGTLAGIDPNVRETVSLCHTMIALYNPIV